MKKVTQISFVFSFIENANTDQSSLKHEKFTRFAYLIRHFRTEILAIVGVFVKGSDWLWLSRDHMTMRLSES